MNRTFEWRVVITTILSVLSIVPCQCAHVTYILHPKMRKINAVRMTLKLISCTLWRMRRARSRSSQGLQQLRGNVSAPGARRASFWTRAPPVTF